ncbi:MAG TPA: DinB family protein [Acidobacteriaceae bacterium]|nr:DinB family protein [Acidobacteriaceae bacterium]
MSQESPNPAGRAAPRPSISAPATEPWLRGTLTQFPAAQRAVLHALELAREDTMQWCGPLAGEEMHARPYGLAPVAFQLRHIVGSLDRLLTYAEGNSLDAAQLKALAEEMRLEGSKEEILAEFESGLSVAERRVCAIDFAAWPEPREVGRRKLPTTVAGLLIHCAEHTQRHVGQAITTAKVLLELRAQPSA